ncbi:NAD(P)/FAD-dependent oxidoreductase [Methyloferula stellata]|uniref:NAD(P)/FAD-dependent oxidoreductase n=1 Tax=Methyloferula stellata TaxID=876270 RepID=UPI00059129C1|nr:NAD(P)/FAD-dependent oxidoreductase [Methyloferula stellata]
MSRSSSSLPPQARVTVAIIGAGPAGIGMARVLRDLAIPHVRIFERKSIGASFKLWPGTTHFITPSFPSNAFGLTDLNAVSFDSSPAHVLRREHMTGAEYAIYLEEAVDAFGLDVTTGIDIFGLDPDGSDIVLHTSRGEVRTRFVIWAAGQFQYPNMALPGSEHGIHSSQIRLWSDYPGGEAIVVGGYESGIDAAIGLAAAGKSVTLLSRSAPWESEDGDPGIALSPLTCQRLNMALQQKRPIKLVGDADIVRIERHGEQVALRTADGRVWTTQSFPVLATGFTGSTSLIGHWLERDGEGHAALTGHDESTILSGLFLVGPEVCHQGHPLSFIYEFRQRFAAVGHAIAERLGIDTAPLDAYRARNMFLDEADCCAHESAC